MQLNEKPIWDLHKFKISGGSQTNNATRANPASDATPPGVASLGGLGVPELERMAGMSDPSVFSQFLQNPALAQMMQSLFSNPQYMDQVLIGLY